MPHMKNANTTYTPSLAARGASWTPHLLIIMLVWSTWAVLMWHGGRWQLFTEQWRSHRPRHTGVRQLRRNHPLSQDRLHPELSKLRSHGISP